MEARQLEAKYDWDAAAELYEDTLPALNVDHASPELAKVMELLAKSRFKAAFQSENREEFKRRMRLAESSYDSLAGLYEKTGETGLASRAMARKSFAIFWIEDDFSKRRRIIDIVVSQVEDAVRKLSDRGNKEELAKTRRDLLDYFLEAEFIDLNWASRKKRFEKVLEVGQKAIEEFESLGEPHWENLAECLSITLDFLAWLPYQVLEPSTFPEMTAKARTLQKKLAKVSEKYPTPYTICLAEKDRGTLVFLGLIEDDHSKAFAASVDSTIKARETGDTRLIGWISHRAIIHSRWMGEKGEEAEKRREILETGIAIGSVGMKSLEIPWEQELLYDTNEFLADCYNAMANSVESDPEKKRVLLRKAIEIAEKGEAYAPFPNANHALSKATQALVTLETNVQEKARLLKDAMRVRTASVKAIDKVMGPYGRARGVQRNYLALIKVELAKIETDPGLKLDLLKGAANDMQQCIDIVSRWATTDFFLDSLADFEERYGDILLELHRVSNTANQPQEAVKRYETSIEHRRKAGLNPAAPTMWKLARAYDASGDLQSASQTFRTAADDYRILAKKVPGSGAALEELAYYMEGCAWVEEARLHHNEERYLDAAENYVKAASILSETDNYSHLSTHYSACVLLERGEAASNQDKPQDAGQFFSSAVRLFDEARLGLERDLRHRVGLERKELDDWVAITLGRERYCGGRIKLEKAKLLDRSGEKEASATEYYSASEVFKALAKTAQTEQARHELDTLRLFCEAWSKMKEAEAKAAPEIYEEAVEIFLKTEKIATKEKMRLLARANSSICRALASGTLFRRTRDTGLYSEIKKQLEAAADYYQEGDFKNAAEWTRATSRLFDALVYLADAESEKELKKRTELFHLAEKHLELAARLYGQAGFSKKREEALRHLEKAREEKELLLAPLDALSGNPSSNPSITPVSLVRDQSPGLEKFEGAHVVGNLDLSEREMGVGSGVMMELELANVGRTPAMLLRLENVSVGGLELDRDRITEKVKDDLIDLKGRRLEYLKTHDVRIPLKAISKGRFELRPKIVFVDERGNKGSYELGPATVTIGELGISGWLKGPK